MTTLKEFIANLGACKSATDWSAAQPSFTEAYNKAPKPEWLLWIIFAGCADVAAVRQKLSELIAFMRTDIESAVKPTDAARTVTGILGTLLHELLSSDTPAQVQTRMQPLQQQVLALHVPFTEGMGLEEYAQSSTALNVAAALVQLSWARSPRGAAEASSALATLWTSLQVALQRATDEAAVCVTLRAAFPATPPAGL